MVALCCLNFAPQSPPTLALHTPQTRHLPLWRDVIEGRIIPGALYRREFGRVIIVYVGRILGDGCIPNEQFVPHFAEWTL